MPKKILANEQFLRDSSKDPYLGYGFGLIAYRSLLETLIIGYFILSCMMYPVSQIYARGGGYGRLFENDQDSYAKWSLGNLGYSSVQCSLTQSGIDTVALQCPYGFLGTIVDDGIGINQKDLDFYDYCLAKESFGNKKCSDAVNATYVKETFQKECYEKKKCSIDTTKLLQTVKEEDSQCLDHAFIFIQYKCYQPEDVQY